MTTTSGRSPGAAIATASRPSAASPTTSIPSSSARIIRKPVRTSCWSSTRRTRMLMPPAPRRRSAGGRVTRKPVAVGCATSVPRSIVARSRIPISPRPSCGGSTALGARGPRWSSTVISSASDAVAHDHARAAAARVLERVRERLLDDPVGGDREARVERARVALDDELHLEARGSELLQQLVETVEPGRRVRGLLVAQDPEHPAHVGQRQAARWTRSPRAPSAPRPGASR